MKIYTIITEGIFDYDAEAMKIESFLDIVSASECFDRQVKDARRIVAQHDWEILDDDEFCFSAGEEGYYASSHVSVAMNISEVGVHSWELQSDVETMAVDEIRQLLAQTPNNAWHFGHDYCDEDGGGDIPFVNAHHVMQDDTICEIGIDAICIDGNNDLVILYHLYSMDEIGGDQFEDNFIQCVMPQDYHIVAYELWKAIKE